MESNVLNSLGLGNLDIGIIFLVLTIVLFIVLVMAVVLWVEFSKLKKRYNRFCGGRNAKSLEKEIGSLFSENQELKEQVDKNSRNIRHLYRKMETTVQKVGLVKYDAFNQMGGKLSFSLCLLDEKDNGFILNSIYGTDGGSYSYIKEVKDGTCNITMSAEEEKALSIAMHE